MTLIFTICSVNYLAQAKTLEASLLRHQPDATFVIGLTDVLAGKSIDTQQLPKATLIEVEVLSIKNFAWMCRHYDITELNTAVKPYFIEYLFAHYPNAQNILYFDPDIIVYQPLSPILSALQHHALVLTPHICSPVADEWHPSEETHLNTGIFNLGFIGLSRRAETHQFVQWWQQKLAYQCKIDLENGLFVDQNWVNFAPFYIESTCIEKHLGLNVAYWNLHERYLSCREGTWVVNENIPLVFFHFSGYQLHMPQVLSKYQNRFSFQNRPDVLPLFEDYAAQLAHNGNAYFQQFVCSYIRPAKLIRYRRVRKVLAYPVEKLINWLSMMEQQ